MEEKTLKEEAIRSVESRLVTSGREEAGKKTPGMCNCYVHFHYLHLNSNMLPKLARQWHLFTDCSV